MSRTKAELVWTFYRWLLLGRLNLSDGAGDWGEPCKVAIVQQCVTTYTGSQICPKVSG